MPGVTVPSGSKMKSFPERLTVMSVPVRAAGVLTSGTVTVSSAFVAGSVNEIR